MYFRLKIWLIPPAFLGRNERAGQVGLLSSLTIPGLAIEPKLS
jgi:hypothetical protein